MNYTAYQPYTRVDFYRRALLIGLGAQLLAPSVLLAQDSSTNAPMEMKKTVITGSLIPTADTLGVAPVEVISAEVIRQSGATDVLSALKKISTSFAGAGNIGQTLNNGGFGEANLAIRNLDTLILLDGRRLANSSFSNGAAVDVNTLPLSMIERIEVLKDGSSTIYGSDAIGGVVNIITKKNYNGAEVSGRYGFATGKGSYSEERASIVGGASTEKTSIVVGADYYHSTPLLTKDRKVGSLGITDAINQDVAPPTYISPSYPGRVGNSILAGSPFAVGTPGYNASVVTPPIVAGGPFTSVTAYNAAALAQLGYSPYLDLAATPGGMADDGAGVSNYPLLNTTQLGTLTIQEQNRRNAFANFNHEIFGKNLEVYAQFFYANTFSEGQLAPSPVSSLGGNNIAVPADNPYNPFGIDLGLNGAGSPRIRSRFLGFGNRTFQAETDYYHFVAGLKGDITENYHWDAAYNYNRSAQTQYTRNAVSGSALNLALKPDFSIPSPAGKPAGYYSQLLDFSGNAVPTYNIFGLAGTPGLNAPETIDAMRATFYQSGVSELWNMEATLNGTPFELPAGSFAFAVGGQYQTESLAIDFDGLSKAALVPGLNPAYPLPKKSRDRYAGYIEASIPITSPKMDVPGLYRFEIEASGRYESLTPGGDSEVPKVGFKWQPIDEQVSIRGSYSQGFIAPSLYELYGPPAVSNPTINVGGVSAQQTVYLQHNPNLPPATSENYTIGIVYSPKQIKNLTVTAEFYRIEETGFSYNPDANTIVADLNAQGAASAAAGGFLFDDGSKLVSNAPNQVTANNFGTLNIPSLPGASQKTDGLDFTLAYEIPTDTAGKFTFGVNANLLLSYYVALGPNQPYYAYNGQYTDVQVVSGANGALPDFLISPSLTWEYNNFTASVLAEYVPGITDFGDAHPAGGSSSNSYTVSGNPWKVPDYYLINLQLSYDFRSDSGKKWYDGTRLTVGVNNLTDNAAPLIASSSEDFTDKSTYDILGRFIYFEISKKF